MDHQHLESLYPADTRFEEINDILSFIRNGSSCQLIGMPGVGRGNICKFLSYNHKIRVKHLGDQQTQFHFVYISLAEVKSKPQGEVIKFMFLELVSSLHERRMDEAFKKTDELFKRALSYKDELVLSQGLKDAIDYLVHEQNMHIIFMLERFELYLPQLTDDFFVYLRGLRERAKYKFSVIFSVTKPLEDLVEPKILADFYEFFVGHNVFVRVYDKIGTAFRIDYLETISQKKISSPIFTTLVKETGGHGKLTRLGAEALLATDTKPKNLQQFLLSQKTINKTLEEICNFLTPSELVCLTTLANNEKAKTETALLFFHEIGLLGEKETFTIPLLKAFLCDTKDTVENEHIIYDEKTESIKKGAINLSEKFTAAEFRLVKFLLSQEHILVDRDAIINAVWRQTATTEGVTDQALDQLIFRVRKKLEDDPNNPVHIITVKGRGIKFQA